MRRPVVLVLENNPLRMGGLVSILESRDCEVIQAGDPVVAMSLARSKRFHSCVVDLHMSGDPPGGPFGGELFLQEVSKGRFRPKTVVVTQYEATDVQRHAFRDYEVVDFINKVTPSWREELVLAIEKAVERSGINFNQNCELGGGLTLDKLADLLATSNLVATSRKGGKDDVLDLFGMLLHEYDELYIEPLDRGDSGAGVVKVTPVVVTSPGKHKRAGRGVVVKYGSHDEIAREVQNYHRYVYPYLGGYPGRTTVLDGLPAYCWLLAGVKYSFIEADFDRIVRFETFYRSSEDEQIKTAIENLFTDTCKRWYDERNLNFRDLVEWYIGPQRLPELERLFLGLFPEYGGQLLIKIPGLDSSFKRPLDYLSAHKPAAREFRFSITHGDMTPRNIFVDSRDGRTWLIDFASMPEDGFGHRLQDLAKLEVATTFELLDDDDVVAHYELARTLTGQKSLADPIRIPSTLRGRRAYEKALNTIIAIRAMVRELQAPDRGVAEYFYAVYCRTWLALRYLDRSIDIRKKFCVLTFLCVLTETLESRG